MDNEFILRAGAVVAGVIGLAVPNLVAAAKRLRLPSFPARKTDTLADAHTVLEIAQRLKAVGCNKGVALCQQLIDVMLQPAEKKA